jgi:FixJ family two-component response regulator
VEAVKLGAVDFLEKPANIQELMEKIKKARNQKMLLVENKIEDEITKILREKGW